MNNNNRNGEYFTGDIHYPQQNCPLKPMRHIVKRRVRDLIMGEDTTHGDVNGDI